MYGILGGCAGMRTVRVRGALRLCGSGFGRFVGESFPPFGGVGGRRSVNVLNRNFNGALGGGRVKPVFGAVAL